MKEVRQKLTLDQLATYQIKVPGHLDESWSEWAEGMTITVESGGDDTGHHPDWCPALQNLLRRLYSLGLPLMSVNWVGAGKK